VGDGVTAVLQVVNRPAGVLPMRHPCVTVWGHRKGPMTHQEAVAAYKSNDMVELRCDQGFTWFFMFSPENREGMELILQPAQGQGLKHWAEHRIPAARMALAA